MKRIDRASNNDRVNLEMKAKVRNSAQSIIVFFFLICYCVVGNAEGFVGRMFRLPGQLTRSTSIICFRTDFPFIVLCYKSMICFHPKNLLIFRTVGANCYTVHVTLAIAHWFTLNLKHAHFYFNSCLLAHLNFLKQSTRTARNFIHEM